MIAGRVGFVLDGITTFGKQGTHVRVPEGHAHSFWNAGPRPAKCLLIISPPGFAKYFRALAAELGDIRTQEDAVEVRQKLAAEYDIEVVGPPPEISMARS